MIGVTYVYWIILLTFIEIESFFLEEFRSDIWRLAEQRRWRLRSPAVDFSDESLHRVFIKSQDVSTLGD